MKPQKAMLMVIFYPRRSELEKHEQKEEMLSPSQGSSKGGPWIEVAWWTHRILSLFSFVSVCVFVTMCVCEPRVCLVPTEAGVVSEPLKLALLWATMHTWDTEYRLSARAASYLWVILCEPHNLLFFVE